jgi:lipopolysaccharide export system permease protein
MHLGRTFAVYFAWKVAKSILACFAILLVLIVFLDYIELFYRTFTREGFNAWYVFLFALFRMPTTAEVALPLATLFGSLAAFTVANRRLELVIARAAGLSAWQFLLPGAVVGLLIGVLATTVYNPLASFLLNRSIGIWATTMDGAAQGLRQTGDLMWARQDGRDGEWIMSVSDTGDEGLTLLGVTVFRLDDAGRFAERVAANSATLVGEEWVLRDARITASGRPVQAVEEYRIHTYLKPDQIREAFAVTDSISFWSLPRLIRIADQASLPSERFRMRYQALLARPLVLLAMVLLAGVVCLRFSRMGGTGPLILAGIVAGFVLYVINEITSDLGSSGVVSAVIAAWLPAVLATLTAVALLLRQEDG